MPRDTRFNHVWLERTDTDGNSLNLWLKKDKKETTFQCLLCKTGDLECSNQGWSAIVQHMNTKGHIEKMKIVLNNSKLIPEIQNLKHYHTMMLLKLIQFDSAMFESR
jgi:hypothetical protein